MAKSRASISLSPKALSRNICPILIVEGSKLATQALLKAPSFKLLIAAIANLQPTLDLAKHSKGETHRFKSL
jgi:hypothetical protein